MREVRNLQDVQIVLKQLLDWQNQFDTKARDRNQVAFTNNPAGVNPNDLVIVSQLPSMPSIPTPRNQHFTIPWSNGGTAVTGATIPAYIVLKDREGNPMQVAIYAVTAPSTAPFSINLQLNGTNILLADLSIPIGQNGPAIASNFISPTPFFGYPSVVVPVITSGGNAAGITVQCSVKRIHGK